MIKPIGTYGLASVGPSSSRHGISGKMAWLISANRPLASMVREMLQALLPADSAGSVPHVCYRLPYFGDSGLDLQRPKSACGVEGQVR
jgi:hypothetical protein